MCRFVAYKGHPMSLADLLLKPKHSLINQSYHALEREEPLNGDGFGVGWYTPEIDPIPVVFTSITPAWNNMNLFHLSQKTISSCIFAHVRAASVGMHVSEINCHPFQFDKYLWMHNGVIGGFRAIRRRLRESLDDRFYDTIQGTSDSEHAFALFLQFLAREEETGSPAAMSTALEKSIRQINAWTREAHVDEVSRLNIAVTDGETMIATRYVSNPAARANTLYIGKGTDFRVDNDVYHFTASEKTPKVVLVASEPLTVDHHDWHAVPINHMLTITPDMDIRIVPINA